MGPIALDEAGSVKVRAFFGLPPPDAHRDRLQGYLDSCASAAPAFRWTPAPNLHLTVRFLGHVERAVAKGIADRLEDRALQAVTLRLGQLGTFKRGRAVRVVWIGVAEGAAGLRVLAEAVEAETVAAGLEPEARPFAAHLTLARARARDGAPLPDLPPPPDLGAWRAQELVLYQSHLGRAGSVYEPLRTLTLR